jgi:hypothetical protein
MEIPIFWRIPQRPPRQASGLPNLGQLATHEHDVRARHGYVSPAAHGDTDVGANQGRGVVHAVANHSNALTAPLQIGYDPILVLGQHLGDDLNAA